MRIHSSLVQTIVQGGIAVFGHVGLRPQHISVLGGFRAQGRTGSLLDVNYYSAHPHAHNITTRSIPGRKNSRRCTRSSSTSFVMDLMS